MKKKYFGTDGIRGKTGHHPITPAFALQLGWSVGMEIRESFGYGSVLISKDTRLSGYLFESALEAGLVAAGVEVYQLGPMPTPALAYLIRSLRAQAGIMISASHNLYKDNGFKFFSSEGTKFPDKWEIQIEKRLESPLKVVEPHKIGKAHRLSDVHGRYIEFCKSTFPRNYDLRGLKLIIDCANGATYQVAPTLFRELGAQVTVIGDEPNGLNINQGCGSTAPELLRKLVLEQKADIGIAFDGDGDRVTMIDSTGEILDGDQLLYILALEYHRQKRLTGGVVGTLMSNFGLELALRDHSIDFVRAQVGDRHIVQSLLEKQWNLGGESSGHLICFDKTTTGDGIIGALQILQVICERGMSLDQLKQGMFKLTQILINIHVEEQNVLENPKVVKVVASCEDKLGTQGRLLVRHSGTEPLVRVMLEGENESFLQSLADEIAETIRRVAPCP